MVKKIEDSSARNKGTQKIKGAKDKPDPPQSQKKHTRKKPPSRLKFYNVSPNWNAISKEIEKTKKKTETKENKEPQKKEIKKKKKSSTSLYSDPATYPTTIEKKKLKEKEEDSNKTTQLEQVSISKDDPSYSQPTKTLVASVGTTMRGGFPEAYEVLVMNYHGCVLYHKFIKENIPHKLQDQKSVAKNSFEFKKIRDELYALFKKRTVVALKADIFFNVLMIIHPKRAQRSIVDLFEIEDSTSALQELAREYHISMNRRGKNSEPSLEEKANVMLQLYKLKGAEIKAMKEAQKEEDSD